MMFMRAITMIFLAAAALAAPVCGRAADADRAGYPACLGRSVPLRVSMEMPYVRASLGEGAGLFLLDYGANVSSVDLGALRAAKPSGPCAQSAGQHCSFAAFDFGFGPSGADLLTADYSHLVLDFRQAGVMGTDFLSEAVFSLRYGAGLFSRADRADFCSDGALRAAGFAPLSSAGFFSSDLSRLLPLSALNAGYSGPLTVPNIPTVPLRIAGVDAVAQIDTGYSDYIERHAVNINQAFFDRIAAADPGALQRQPEKDKRLSTCVPGVTEAVEAYRLRRGTVAFVDVDGRPARTFSTAQIYLKRTPAAAAGCGGVGTHTRPSAQLGGSFMADLGAAVFDPFSSRVWIPR